MSYFEVKAINLRGEFVIKRVRARDAEEAVSMIKMKGFFPYSLLPEDVVQVLHSPEPKQESRFRRIELFSLLTSVQGIKKKDIVEFTRKLRIFVQAGIPVYQSLTILQTQTKKRRLIKIVKNVADNVEAGKSLTESLARYPKYFNKLYLGLIHAGEASGNLVEILIRLENYLDKILKRKSKLISASIYPSIVILMTIGIISILNIFIIPKFTKAYQSMRMELPGITTTVLSVSTWLSKHWYVVIFTPIAIVALIKLIRFTKHGRHVTDSVLLSIPLIGHIIQKSNLSLFYRTSATLLKSGVMVLDVLKVSCSVIKNVVINRETELIMRGVYEGKAMNEMMKRSRLFDAFAVHMVEVGETSGMFGEMLEETANVYDEELDVLFKRLESLLEPLIIIVLAGIVGTVIIALYMPMVKLTQTLGNMR